MYVWFNRFKVWLKISWRDTQLISYIPRDIMKGICSHSDNDAHFANLEDQLSIPNLLPNVAHHAKTWFRINLFHNFVTQKLKILNRFPNNLNHQYNISTLPKKDDKMPWSKWHRVVNNFLVLFGDICPPLIRKSQIEFPHRSVIRPITFTIISIRRGYKSDQGLSPTIYH